MPAYYKWPAHAGNALLFLIALIVAARNSFPVGATLGALALLNLYLVRKLDLFSREEAWLALQIRKAKMREELLAIEQRLAEEQEKPDAPASPGPPPDAHG